MPLIAERNTEGEGPQLRLAQVSLVSLGEAIGRSPDREAFERALFKARGGAAGKGAAGLGASGVDGADPGSLNIVQLTAASLRHAKIVPSGVSSHQQGGELTQAQVVSL